VILKFNILLEVVYVHVRAKFHQAKSNGSRVFVFTEKKNSAENNTAVAAAGTNKIKQLEAVAVDSVHCLSQNRKWRYKVAEKL